MASREYWRLHRNLCALALRSGQHLVRHANKHTATGEMIEWSGFAAHATDHGALLGLVYARTAP
jgi:hypothetical protein